MTESQNPPVTDQDIEEFVRTFELLGEYIHQINTEKGWWDQEKVVRKQAIELLDTLLLAIPQDQVHKGSQIQLAYDKLVNIITLFTQRNDGELLCLMHSEISEGMEGLRKDLDSDHIPGYKMVEEEMADTIIRIMDYAKARQLRVAEAVFTKVMFNLSRPHKHGGKKF